MDSDGLCTQAQGDYARTYAFWLKLFWFEYGGGVPDIFVNYSASRPLLGGIFLSFNQIIILWTVIQLIQTAGWKRKKNGGLFFFHIKLMTSDTCSIIIQNCICDTLFNMMYSPSQIVPPVFNQVSKFNMAMNSKWKPTSKQVYNHFIFPMLIFFPPSFQVFPH